MDTSAAAPPPTAAASAAPARINDHAARKRDKTAKLQSGQWDRCMFFMPVKRRFCNSPRAAGCMYCGAHVPQQLAPAAGAASTSGDATGAGGKRIPCPVDPTHTIWEKGWRSHVKRCPGKVQQEQREALPCYSRGYNAGAAPAGELAAIDAVRPAGFDVASGAGSATFTGLPAAQPAVGGGGGAAAAAPQLAGSSAGAAGGGDAAGGGGDAGEECEHAGLDAVQATALSTMLLGVPDLRGYLGRIQAWYDVHAAPRLLPQLTDDDAAGATASSRYGAGGRPIASMPKRHENQSLALVRLMDDAGLLADPRSTLVELGAGSGQLAAVLSGLHPGRRLLLVDRMGGIKKHDSLLKKQVAHEFDKVLAAAAAAAADGAGGGSALPIAMAPPPRMEFARLRLDIADFCLARHPAVRGAPVNDPSCSGTGAGLGGWDHDAERKMRAAAAVAHSDGSVGGSRSALPLASAVTAASAADGSAADADADAVACAPPAKRRRVDDDDVDDAAHAPAVALATVPPAASLTPGPVVVFGKHVCGGATDLTLRCFFLAAVPHDKLAVFAGDTVDAAAAAGVDAAGDGAAPAAADATLLPASQLGGACIAICCHQRCDWASYTGKRFFREVLHATPEDFEFVRCLSSWAVSFAHVHSTAAAAASGGAFGAAAAASAAAATSSTMPEPAAGVLESLDAVAKECIGRMCKRLLDAGRLHFVQDVMRYLAAMDASTSAAAAAAVAGGDGGMACLRHYCSVADSPENCALLVSMVASGR